MDDNILIVDDDNLVLRSLYRLFRDSVHRVYLANCAEEGLQLLSSVPCKVVISDHFMQGLQGAEFLALVRRLHPQTVRVLLTGSPCVEAAMQAVNEGEIYRFFTKPWDGGVLKECVRSAIRLYDDAAAVGRQRAAESSERILLERLFPGINTVKKDLAGCCQLDWLSDEEVAAVMADLMEPCEQW